MPTVSVCLAKLCPTSCQALANGSNKPCVIIFIKGFVCIWSEI